MLVDPYVIPRLDKPKTVGFHNCLTNFFDKILGTHVGNTILVDHNFVTTMRNSSDAPPTLLMDSTMSPKCENTEGQGVQAHSLARNTLGVERCVRV
jgi:hypothetical protein